MASQVKVIELLASAQADLIAYQRKHISDLNATIESLMTERNALATQLASATRPNVKPVDSQTVELKDNM